MSKFKLPEIKSRYLERFQKLAANPVATLTGSRILIEPIAEGEVVSEGGLILASPNNQARGEFQYHKSYVAMVLMTGTDTKIPDTEVSVKPGAIVVVSEYGVRPYSTFLPGLAYTEGDIVLSSTHEIHLYFDSVESLHAAVNTLNG